MTRS
ncbi:hypothetical protein YPPY113_2499, partial [Yersinia pestis PY-113]|jgi:hypothetical protein|eukprot:CCRYP_013074-RA/>CCRYP_013074-RA protein AED:0.44 eAED:0.44 QI:2/-1/1/1/-1/0/1/560/4